MEKYDYISQIKEDLREYIKEEIAQGEWNAEYADANRERLMDNAWTEDSVTGNGSGSYFFNEWKSAEAVCHNLDLLGEALDEFNVCGETFRDKFSGEWADVTIRCYLLGQVFDEVMDEVLDEMREAEDKDENEKAEN